MVPLVALHVLTTLFLAQSLHRCSSCQVRSCSNLRRRIDRSGCAVGRLWLQSDCENTGWNVPRASSHAIAAICSSAAGVARGADRIRVVRLSRVPRLGSSKGEWLLKGGPSLLPDSSERCSASVASRLLKGRPSPYRIHRPHSCYTVAL
jgi:hypothetical protein